MFSAFGPVLTFYLLFIYPAHPWVSPGQSIKSWPATPPWVTTHLSGIRHNTQCLWNMAITLPCILSYTTLTPTLPPMGTALHEAASEAIWLATPSAVVLEALTSKMAQSIAMAKTVQTWVLKEIFYLRWKAKISHRFPSNSLLCFRKKREHQMVSIHWELHPQPSVGSRVLTVGAPWVFHSQMYCLTCQLSQHMLPHLCQVSKISLMV